MNTLLIKLLNMSAAGSVLILAVILVRALLRRAPRWMICALWALVAVRLVCPVGIPSPLSVFRLMPSVVSESGEVAFFLPARGSGDGAAGAVLTGGSGEAESVLPGGDSGSGEAGSFGGEDDFISHGEGNGASQNAQGTVWEGAESSDTEMTSAEPGLSLLTLVYPAGLTAMLLYAAVSLLVLRRKVAVSLRQRGNVRICDAVDSPFILGILHPAIYLPSSLSREERRFVLAHERAHLRSLDHVWKPLGFLILSLHWFNPFCHLAYVLACRDIELACDEKVIRDLGRSERVAYAQALLNVSAHRILSACPVAFGESGVKARIKAVLSYKKPAFWAVLAAAAGVVVLVVCFAADPMPSEPDLSFLNYENAVTLIAQSDAALPAVWYPEETSSIVPGTVDNRALARFLDTVRWAKRGKPSQSLPSPGSIEFIIEEDYRITVWQTPRVAAVRFDDQTRYYRTAAGDYEAALAVFSTEVSAESAQVSDQGATEPSQASEQTSTAPGQPTGQAASGAGQPADQDSESENDSSDQTDLPLAVRSGGVTVEPWRCLAYELKWTDEGWVIIDAPPLSDAVDSPEDIPALTLADDFEVEFISYVRKSGLQIYDEEFNLIRDSWYGDTAINWLEPGTYYGVIEAFGPMGRYIESQGSYEENVYNCVFRLNVLDEVTEPYVPDKATGLTEATLHVLGEDYSLTDPEGLARLESWLTDAEILPAGAGCPFGSLLTVTCADGSTFSCCPAEDSCGVIFSNGAYYRYASDNEEFYGLFGYKFPWMG